VSENYENENGQVTIEELSYAIELQKLKKKLAIFFGIMLVTTAIFKLSMSGLGIIDCLLAGWGTATFFYIPGRIKSYFKLSWLPTIIIVVVFYGVMLSLMEKAGAIIFAIPILVVVVDIGYSVYKLISLKKKEE
jgi:hypothetical protein